MNNNQDRINSYIIEEEPLNDSLGNQVQISNQGKLEQDALLVQQGLELLKNNLEENKENQSSRRSYAKVFTIIMVVQLLVINIFVFLQGIKWITLDTSIFNVFLIGVFTQLVAIVSIIFNNVFPKDYDKNKTDLQKALFGKGKSEE